MSTKKEDKNWETLIKLQKNFGDNLKLPSNVEFVLEKNGTQCRIKLNPEKAQTKNMQIDENAFEGWAVALHIALDKPGRIILDVDGAFKTLHYETNGHWGRFLYRVLRFSQQYGDWFELSEHIQTVVDEFEEYLSHHYFTNNLADGEAGIKKQHGDENIVEAEFAKKGKLRSVLKGAFDIGNNEVYRQLPVGLFRIDEEVVANKAYKYGNKTKVFTGGKSAIDLWTWNEDSFEVIELKTNNPMIGIITEIFFYSNYMYDFLVRENKRFVLNHSKETEDDRGYSNILNNMFKKIYGIMLANKYHPILENKDVFDVLNCNGKIEYVKAYYEYDLSVSKKSN